MKQTLFETIRFSPTTLGFYPHDLDYGDQLPTDCVNDVTFEEWLEIINPPEGMSRGVDRDGRPILIPTPVHVPTREEELVAREQIRKTLIAEVDAISPAQWFGFSDDTKISISAYRKNLETFNIEASKLTWPTKPKGVFSDSATKN